ncbi:hypothetical protein [Caballeronia catudaia]|uniref:hypothetical protein n=1 Tax=Caballeronia catudaia TaxID=1777136 RepID=UPI00190EB390|nr:hypothetical protein [Caballeronia catudaia]
MPARDQLNDVMVSQSERAYLVEALDLLMRERSNALRIATAVARARGDRVPDVHDFGLDDILRLSREIAGVSSAEPPSAARQCPDSSNQRECVDRRKAISTS